jgi:hypothetical protein
MHPLNTLITSQRNDVRRRTGTPAPRRRSSTEEAAIVERSDRERNSLTLTMVGTLLSCLLVLMLATVLI